MLRFILLFIAGFGPGLIFSQAFKINPVETDSLLFEHPDKVIQNIQIVGNDITKNHIILRELSWQLNDTISSENFLSELEQSKKNLLNTSLFNFVKIDWALLDPSHVFIVVNVKERWYLFPVPIFEIDDNNFNTWWKDKDYSRINYGMNVIRNNFRGRKEKLSLTAQFGFTERLRLKYTVPYINKSQKVGFGTKFSYNRLDQIAYTSDDNERLQFKSNDKDATQNLGLGFNFSFRKKIFNTHYIGLDYDRYSILDTVVQLNPEYLGGGNHKNQFFSFYYQFIHDKRDSKNYPLEGSLFSARFKKSGLGINKDGIDLGNISLLHKKYYDLKNRFYFAHSLRTELALNNNQPYLLQNGLGYSSSFAIRAYEYYVIDGQNIGLAKTQLKYQLIRPKVASIPYIPYEKISEFHYSLYIGVFGDLAYVEDNTGYPNNRLANTWQYSTGVGLDFISYYDVVLRLEYSLNKLGESGLFLHFVAPI